MARNERGGEKELAAVGEMPDMFRMVVIVLDGDKRGTAVFRAWGCRHSADLPIADIRREPALARP